MQGGLLSIRSLTPRWVCKKGNKRGWGEVGRREERKEDRGEKEINKERPSLTEELRKAERKMLNGTTNQTLALSLVGFKFFLYFRWERHCRWELRSCLEISS